MSERALRGRRALITGASRGIGEAVAVAFARGGADLVLAARTQSDLERVAERCRAEGVDVAAHPVDMRDPAAVEALAVDAGAIDILVNNAGLGHFAPVHELKLEQWDEMFDVNVRSVFYLTHLIVPRMIEAGRGDIVNVASIAGIRSYAGGAGYNATKFAIRGFSEAIQKDLRPYGIRVMMVSPARVDTYFSGRKREDWAHYLQPDDVADAIVFAVTQPARSGVREVIMVGTEQEW